MPVNSINFLLFFIIVFGLYYGLSSKKVIYQNVVLLMASIVYYCIIDLKLFALIALSTIIFYILGILLENGKTSKSKSLWLSIGVSLGIGLLLYFKYLNFFIDSFILLFNSFGLNTNPVSFNIILPIGVSFFTFKLISYLLEIQRGKIQATRDFIAFANYILFFPTIVSGPIDHANSFLPQLENTRKFEFNLGYDGLRQILWGMFKKMIIADNLSVVIDNVWNNIDLSNGSTLLIVCLLFPMQLYADFSGYSDMAIGTGKLLGLKITKNFNYPFFSQNIAEFWRNWHISLTSWLTDYVFTPLNIKFRDMENTGIMLAILINFFIIGLWHGANWTFVLFGVVHGILFIPLIITGEFFKKRKLKTNSYDLPPFYAVWKMIQTYLIFAFSLLLFRAPNISTVWKFISGIFQSSILKQPQLGYIGELTPALFIAALVIAFEWKQRKMEYALQIDNLIQNRWTKMVLYIGIATLTVLFKGGSTGFIYAQF